MKKIKGFTLIELLIVVAIIAILAAIAVPNFLEAQIRAKSSRAQSDMRSLATAIESYMVDNNTFPVAVALNTNAGINPGVDSNGAVVASGTVSNITKSMTNISGSGWKRPTFATNDNNTLSLMTLTTPISYMTSYPSDPFATSKMLPFGYMNAKDTGWMLWSYGPDMDEKTEGQLGSSAKFDYLANSAATVATPWAAGDARMTVYNPFASDPNATLIAGGYTYDATNGSTSAGDIWRVKQ